MRHSRVVVRKFAMRMMPRERVELPSRRCKLRILPLNERGEKFGCGTPSCTANQAYETQRGTRLSPAMVDPVGVAPTKTRFWAERVF